MQMPHPQQQAQPQSNFNQKAAHYNAEIAAMFQSKEFMQSSIEDRRQIIGTAIFKHVSEIVGDQHSPKVTGMIIDLDPVDLN